MKFLISIPKLVDPASSRTSHSGCSFWVLTSFTPPVTLQPCSTFPAIYRLSHFVFYEHPLLVSRSMFESLLNTIPSPLMSAASVISAERVCLPKHTPYSVFLHITEMFIPWCLLVEWTNHVVPHKREVDRMWSTFNRILIGTKGFQPVLERYHGSH